MQGMLEWLRTPYSPSGVLDSALAVDNPLAKDAYREAGPSNVERDGVRRGGGWSCVGFAVA